MKILIITQYFYPENFRINDIAFNLKKKGHDITVLTGKPNYPKGEYFDGYSWKNPSHEKIKGIDIYRANLFLRKKAGGFRLFLNYSSFIIFGLLKILSLQKEFDKVFVYAPSPITVGFLGYVAAKKFKCKSYLWVHDLWPESVRVAGGINNTFILSSINLMTKLIYSLTDMILVQSPYFKKYLTNQGVSKDKIFYYPYYAEAFYKIVKPKNSIKKLFPKGLNILFAGNIGVAQSFDTIIDAARILNKKIKELNFIILGDGRDKERILNKISAYSLEKKFKFLGTFPPEEMSDFFACADALLVSLKNEKIFSMTIPGKLQSYLACGKPIIASLDGVGAKIIRDSLCGYVSDSENPKDLADSIYNFSKLDFNERFKMGLNGRKVYEKEFERNKLLKRLIDIFEK